MLVFDNQFCPSRRRRNVQSYVSNSPGCFTTFVQREWQRLSINSVNVGFHYIHSTSSHTEGISLTKMVIPHCPSSRRLANLTTRSGQQRYIMEDRDSSSRHTPILHTSSISYCIHRYGLFRLLCFSILVKDVQMAG